MAAVPRRPSVQIARVQRTDGSVTLGLRVRVGGADERVPLGNANDGAMNHGRDDAEAARVFVDYDSCVATRRRARGVLR